MKRSISKRQVLMAAVSVVVAIAVGASAVGLVRAHEDLDDLMRLLGIEQTRKPDHDAIAEALFDAASYELGRRIFFESTFGGNGRTCATCHVPRDEFTFSPELARSRFELDPEDPLFRPIDSNDGEGRDYSNILDHALVRVSITLHENVSVVGDPDRRTIDVWRGTPTIANVALTAPFLSDGRALDLIEQASGAIRDHMQPAREPHQWELEALESFMTENFYPLRARSQRNINDPILKEPGFTVPIESPAARSGRQLFQQNCLICHDGELFARPANPNTPLFSTVFVSERNELGLPVWTLEFKNADGSGTIVETPDPGLAAITGRLDHLNAFETTQLRGEKHTAPDFHDNSAKTLDEVIEHYNDFFPGIGVRGRDKNALIAYLETL